MRAWPEKPLMLGRGVDVPVPVILVGAFGGMAADGIIGMFVGATLLALAWQLATGWVDENPDANSSSGVSEPRVLPWRLRLVRADHRRRAT
jgi:predicted PurR-regulated permease PerM